MLELYIGNMKADLTGQESILTQKTRTDYTNPTIVKNSFTKTVSLPGTKANSFIFNFLWKLDRVQTVEDFNPSRRVPFTLTENGNLIESGYIKLDKINKTYDTVSYDCTLFGELGNILYELSYKVDEETGDVTPLTLGDLDYNMKEFTPSGNIDFNISLNLVKNGWDHLDKTDEDDSGYNTFNFAICSNGIPKADNFDPKKTMTSILGSDYTTRKAAVNWDGTDYDREAFPTSKEVDGISYSYIDTMLSKMDQTAYLALMEMDKGISCIEARDFRSYLQRPILRLKAVFEAIGRYLNKHLGWTLDITDDFFTREEFLNSWITLSMLYEINPKVETGTYFTQKELLSNTSSPASYLVSYCKSYGIYIDPDIQAKTLRLIRLPHFFTGEEENLIVDQSQQMEITPLSFDKSAYTFDFAEGDGQFLKKYKDTYGVAYGTKRVNTGYRFDASVAPYITNNIFRTAADTIEQSAYFHYNYDGGAGNTKVENEYPIAVAALTKAPKYSLFRVDSNHHPFINADGTVDRYGAEMTKNTTTRTPDDIWGYMYATNKWSGLQKGIYQDTLARLQFCDEKGEAKDGKDVLIRYNGKVRAHAGWCKSYDSTYDTTKSENTKFIDYTDADGRGIVKYLISDDSYAVKLVLGTNCYYDIPSPTETPYGLFARRLDELPTFNRVKIDYGSFFYNPAERHDNWIGANITRIGSATTDYSGQEYLTVNYPDSSSYVYWNFANFTRNHKYLIVSKMICSSSYYYLGFLNYETLYSRATAEITGSSRSWKISAAVVSSSDNSFNNPGKIRPRQSGNNTMNIAWYTVIDLTNLGLTNLTAEEGIKFFKFDQYNNYGTPYFVTSTLDFGVSREIGIPATIILPNSDIYNRYWNRYIADVYSIDTRIIKGKVYLPNIQDSFRKFYYYDNATWILSSIQDWNNETKLCTGTFTKVNDKQNYLND